MTTKLDPKTESFVRVLDRAANNDDARADIDCGATAAHMRKLATSLELNSKLWARSSAKLSAFMQDRYNRGADPEALCGGYHGDVAVLVIQRLERDLAETRAKVESLEGQLRDRITGEDYPWDI